MYKLKGIIARRSQPGSRYERVLDASSITLEQLISKYRDVLWELTHDQDLSNTNMTLVVDDIIDQLFTIDRSKTVPQYLDSIGATTLPVKMSAPTISAQYLKQTDMLEYGSRATLVDEKWIASKHRHRIDMINLHLTDNSGRYKEYYENCLFSVNGYLHLSDYDVKGIYLKDAGLTTYLSNAMQVSALSFKTIGKIECIPIKDEHIKRINGRRLQDGFYLEFPELDFAGKTVMLSIAGHLHFGDQDYSVTSQSTVKIDWSKMPIMQRYRLSRNKMDWGKLPDLIDHTVAENNMYFNHQALTEDESVMAVLDMSQTFLIVIDRGELSYDHEIMERTALPGRYQYHQNPYGPIMLGDGTLPPFKVRKEGGDVHFIILEPSNWTYRPVEDTRSGQTPVLHMSADQSNHPKYLSEGYMLKIGTETVSFDLPSTRP